MTNGRWVHAVDIRGSVPQRWETGDAVAMDALRQRVADLSLSGFPGGGSIATDGVMFQLMMTVGVDEELSRDDESHATDVLLAWLTSEGVDVADCTVRTHHLPPQQ